MNIGQDQALRSIALTIPSSIRAEVNLLNMAFFLLSIQLLVRNSHLKRWTRPISSYLIVKLLFVVAEPAQFYFSITLSTSATCCVIFYSRILVHSVTVVIAWVIRRRENGLFQHYPLYYLDLACTLASWLA